MTEELPNDLIEQLQRLELATPAQVRGVQGRVRRLARELPLFESVWVDALAQSRAITRYQAAELNAGRGDRLRVGPFLLCEKRASLGYADQYRARRAGTTQTVRLAVIERSNDSNSIVDQLNELADARQRLNLACLTPVVEAGWTHDQENEEHGRIWVAAHDLPYRSAAEWLAPGGRFAPHRVARIAEAMLEGLVALEAVGLSHGDIGALNLLLDAHDRVALAWPGLRGILRPQEGYAAADLPPEFFDTLAPERIRDGGRPTIQSDIYACGCLWRHLLTGRPTIPGADALAKLRGHQTADVEDVRRLAPDTPARLAKAISGCLARDSDSRPQSMAALAAMLGSRKNGDRSTSPKRSGRGSPGVARRGSPDPAETRDRRSPRAAPTERQETYGPRFRRGRETRAERQPAATAWRWSALAGCLLVAVVAAWAAFGPGRETPVADSGVEPSQPQSKVDPAGAYESTAVGSPRSEPNVASPEILLDAGRSTPTAEQGDLVLSAGEPVTLESLNLQPGQTVRGEPGARPTIVAPPNGLVVSVEDVRFEQIDFLCPPSGSLGAEADSDSPAILRVTASRCSWNGCTFQASAGSGSASAIHWTYPLQDDPLGLPSGRLRLRDCVFLGGGTALACSTRGAIAVEFTNVLGVDVGSLIRLDHWPSEDEPTSLALTDVTLRDSGSLVQCHCEQPSTASGALSVQASRCVLMLRPKAPLLSLFATQAPQTLLTNIYWTGEGSLVSPDAVIAAWRSPEGDLRRLDDAALAISGLVRGEVEFAGPPRQGAASNQVVEWQAPLRSPDPPGVATKGLAWPLQ